MKPKEYPAAVFHLICMNLAAGSKVESFRLHKAEVCKSVALVSSGFLKFSGKYYADLWEFPLEAMLVIIDGRKEGKPFHPDLVTERFQIRGGEYKRGESISIWLPPFSRPDDQILDLIPSLISLAKIEAGRVVIPKQV